MPATITWTVKDADGDFASISAWESATQGNLTTAWGVEVSGTSGTFQVGEALSFSVSGATATFRSLSGTSMRFEVTSGTPATGDTITGGASSATATLDSVTYNDGEIRQAECYAFEDTTAVVVAGSTTDSTRYRRIFAASGAEAQMPWSTSAYRLVVTDGTVGALDCNEPFLKVEGIQVQNDHATNNIACIRFGANSSENVTVDRCIVRMTLTAGTAIRGGFFWSGSMNAGDTIRVSNCVAIGVLTSNASSGGFAVNDGTAYIYNCTSYGCTAGFRRTAGTAVIKNCLGANSTTADFTGTFDADSDYNASTDATAPGTNGRQSQTFTFVDAGGGDLHLASADAGAQDFGVDLSADADFPITTDFDGETRSGSWDIGADEIADTTARSVSDGVDLGETTTADTPVSKSASDGVSLGDASTFPDEDNERAVSEGVTVGESVQGARGLVDALSDGVHVGEDFTTTFGDDSGPDGILAGDVADMSVTVGASASAGVLVGESMTTHLTARTDDGVSVGDGATPGAINLLDGVLLGTSIALLLDYNDFLSDGVSLGDRGRHPLGLQNYGTINPALLRGISRRRR